MYRGGEVQSHFACVLRRQGGRRLIVSGEFGRPTLVDGMHAMKMPNSYSCRKKSQELGIFPRQPRK